MRALTCRTLIGKLGEGQEKKSMGGTTAFKMFKMLDSRAQDDSSSDDNLQTVHKKTIKLVHIGQARLSTNAFSLQTHAFKLSPPSA